jgi:ElaB/YqjD/DUF883 family membrane-anchored ribosome-binding protein
MTNAEFKTKIAETSDPDWFNSISETFNFNYIGINLKLEGLTAIYEYVNQQVDGWNNIETSLPIELENSKTYFNQLKDSIIKFLNNYHNQANNNLTYYWSNVQRLITSTNNYPLPYNIPETEFLIKVHKESPHYFQGAYAFITGNKFNINNKDSFFGALLAYEFSRKDTSEIVERRDAEKLSISKIRNDFQNYLSKSEKQLTEHLSNARKNFQEYVNIIDAFKADKEKLFSSWFETSQRDFGKFKQDAEKKIEDLEKTYEELLRLKKPAEYWNLRAQELKKQGWKSLYWLIGIIAFACATLYFLLWLTPEGMLKSFFNDDKSLAIRWSIIFVTFISFLVVGIRALMKVTFSSFHLARDAEERERLTYVYLAMIKDSSIDKEDRLLVMQSLFSRAETGLLKDDSSPSMPSVGSFFDKVNLK